MPDDPRVYSADELFEQMERDELEDSPLAQSGKMTPRDYARKVGKEPQIIYYYMRGANPRLKKYYCDCGRVVIDVAEADALFAEQAAKHKVKGQ